MMKIGITKNTSEKGIFSAYQGWLLRFNPVIEFHELSFQRNQPDEIEQCDGLLLTGGGDIDPKVYGRGDGAAHTEGVDSKRDGFEFKVIEKALAKGMPMLGICRGMQSVNVYCGGSLHIDLASSGFSRHDDAEGKGRRHAVIVEPQSMLASICGHERGEVNSTHHQGVDHVGKGLAVNARSEDGVVEGLEWDDRSTAAFLILVQWHPERMKDLSNPFADKIGRAFLEDVSKM